MSDERKEAMGKTKLAEKGARPTDTEKLTRLPLEALLYYVLYGDERLARLT